MIFYFSCDIINKYNLSIKIFKHCKISAIHHYNRCRRFLTDDDSFTCK